MLHCPGLGFLWVDPLAAQETNQFHWNIPLEAIKLAIDGVGPDLTAQLLNGGYG